MRQLVRGEKVKLRDLTSTNTVEIGIDIASGAGQSFDVSLFGVDQHGKLSDDRYFIFYNQPTSPEGALQSLGPQGPSVERFRLALDRLPASIQRVVVTLTIDGPNTMATLRQGALRLNANNVETAFFPFDGAVFSTERAIIVGELYLKDGVWRLSAVAQGFAGGLSALLEHFGGEEVQKPASSPPASPAALSLEKRVEREAPQLVSLVKQAGISLKKAGLDTHRAQVALVLDISGSMHSLYNSGAIQKLAERVLALGLRFDDNGEVDVFLFGARAHDVGPMTLTNFKNFMTNMLSRYPLEDSTRYGKALEVVRGHYGYQNHSRRPVRGQLPTYVMFVTDGATQDEDETRRQLVTASYEPIFWQFMAIGKSNKARGQSGFRGILSRMVSSNFTFLEELDSGVRGRFIDNANFFSVEHPKDIPDETLYDLLMTEYPSWLKLAREKNLIS